VTARSITSDPNTGIPDLVRSLTQDSKRLVADEIRLAKIEAKESTHRAARGAIWMALAFGASVVMLAALTIFLTTLIGRMANGHMWLGALVTGVLEIGAGVYFVKRGIKAMVAPSYSLEESRGAIVDTAHWATSR
jgi:hypothetical protein